MTTPHRTPETYPPVRRAGRFGLRVPIATGTRVVRVVDNGRVTGVEIEDTTGRREIVACNTVALTADSPFRWRTRRFDPGLRSGSSQPRPT